MRLPPLADAARVSVVVPARDAAATLAPSVRSALGQQGDFPLDVTIAVGPSRDATAEIARDIAASDRRVAVVDNPSGRTPSGLNAAIAASCGEVVVRLDAHAVLPAGYVDRALSTLRSTGAVNVGGMQVAIADSGFARAVAAAMSSRFGAGDATYRVGGAPGAVDTVFLGVFRREALRAVGGFDERLRRNQDYELNHRLRAAGGLVWFDPGLAVGYRPRDSARALARQYFEYGQWRRLTAGMHPRSLKARQVAPPALVAALAGAAATAVTGSVRPLAALTGAYATGLVAAGAVAARPRTDAPRVALALAVMHLSWGLGFIVGVPRSHLPDERLQPTGR